MATKHRHPPKHGIPEERFFPKVEWGNQHNGTRCLLWTGALAKGYGKFYDGTRVILAHRWLYERWVGPIPGGLQLDHLCLVKNCVNPMHLEPVTNQENARRAKALITHCRQGHPYNEENTYITAEGWRACRTCHGWSGPY